MGCIMLAITLLLSSTIVPICHSMAVGFNLSHIHSDVIVTTGVKVPETKRAVPLSPQEKDEEPGWMRRQLLKFGEISSRLGNSMGGTASKLTGALEKICQVVKTVIPVIAAVCHVGSFQFCTAATEGPQELANAIAPSNLELEIDK